MDALAVSELARLEAMPNDDLLHLPPMSTQEAKVGEHRVKLDCYHRTTARGEHMIAIVAWRPNARGIWDEPHVEGFVIEHGGARRPLTQEETWEFQ